MMQKKQGRPLYTARALVTLGSLLSLNAPCFVVYFEVCCAIWPLYVRRAALERRQGLHQVSWLICRVLVIFVPRSINQGEIFQCPIAQGADRLPE